jgi:ADP-heptose:LPS heptosyltransferase
MKVLILRFSSIGDIVLTTPVIRCLKKNTGAEIHYAVKAAYSSIVENNPHISKVHVLRDYMEEIIEPIKKEKYDLIIDLHHNLRTLQIKKALKKVPSKSFHKLNVEKWLLTALKINRMPAVHIVDRYMKTVEHLGVRNDGMGLDYFIPKIDEVKESDIPAAHLAGYYGFVIGAAHGTKQLPAEKVKEICARVDHPVMLLGGKDDYQTGKEIAAADPFKIYNACGKFNLNESADLVRRAKCIVTNDTGLMHMAAAFKKPIISLWGNTVPAFGMTPYYGHYNIQNAMVEVRGLRCRPCSKIGYDACPRGHFKCMNQIHNEDVVTWINRFLGREA